MVTDGAGTVHYRPRATWLPGHLRQQGGGQGGDGKIGTTIMIMSNFSFSLSCFLCVTILEL